MENCKIYWYNSINSFSERMGYHDSARILHETNQTVH